MQLRICWLAIVCLLISSPPPAAAQEMTQFASRYYKVQTNLSIAVAKPICAHMDKVFAEYSRRLGRAGFRIRNKSPMNLMLFADQKSYMEGLAKHDVNGAGSGGMFFHDGNAAALAVWLGGHQPSQYLSTLQHEGFHQFAYLTIGSMPTWANEGLAEYFGDALLVRGKFQLGLVSQSRIDDLQKAIKDHQSFGFGELLNMTGTQWSDRVARRDPRTRIMYLQSWSIVYFLVHGDNGRYESRFMAYLRELAGGRSSEQAFAATFGSNDYAPLEARWKKFVAELKPDALSVAVERATFLADGLMTLQQSHTQIQTLEQLQIQLKRIKFQYATGSHGNPIVLRAADPRNFTPPPPDRPGSEPKIILTPSTQEDLPATLQITGLKVDLTVQWHRVDQGALSYEIELK